MKFRIRYSSAVGGYYAEIYSAAGALLAQAGWWSPADYALAVRWARATMAAGSTTYPQQIVFSIN